MKPYVKPVIIYEQFMLSQSIAACGFDMNLTEAIRCSAVGDDEFDLSGLVLLLDWCDHDISDSDWSMICYHNGATDDPNMRIFMS